MGQLSNDLSLDLMNYPKHGHDPKLNREDLEQPPAIHDAAAHGPNAQWPSLHTMIFGYTYLAG